MNEQGHPLTDTALRQVLESESRARDRIAAEEQKAATALEAARSEARQIETEAVEEAGVFQARCADEAEQRLSDLRETAEQRLADIESESTLPRIKTAAEAVARELAGIKTADDEERAPRGNRASV